MSLPPIPPWSGLHPAVVHFPVALLIVAAVLVLAGAFPGRFAAGVRLAAALVMALGVLGAAIAVETGEASAELHRPLAGEAGALLEQHEALGEAVRNLFAAFLMTYLVVAAVPVLWRGRLAAREVTALHLGFLVCYLAASAVVVRTAALGGELVHRWGVGRITAGGAHTSQDAEVPRSALDGRDEPAHPP